MSDADSRVRRALSGDRSLAATRSVPVDDIRIRAGGGGRTVQAYAAVFMTPAPVSDQDGQYDEQLARTAFNKSVRDFNSGGSSRIFSVYNHARTLHGTPSDLASIPLGRPTVIKPDSKGLYTEVVYNEGDYADAVLEAIRNQSLTGMSFTGVFLQSDPQLKRGQLYRPGADGSLPLVTRLEIALIEFGPTPIPVYDDAAVVGVRSQEAGMAGASGRAAGPVPYERKPGENVQCPACGNYNMPDAEYCDQDGEQLPGSAFPGGQQPYARQPGEDVQCPNCTRFNDDDAIDCDQCGQALPVSAYAGAPGAEDPAAAATSSSGRNPAEGRERAAAAVDRSEWDASKAWHNGAAADDPGAFYKGICAGEKTSGDPATQAHWALPYKYTPASPPNAAGVRDALSRLPQTQGLANAGAAKTLLQGLMKDVDPAYEPPPASGRAGDMTADEAQDDDDAGERAAAAAPAATDDDAPDHGPVTGSHTHAHSAFGTQGGDDTHGHEHAHQGDAVHEHDHPAAPPAAPQDSGRSGTGNPAAATGTEPPAQHSESTTDRQAGQDGSTHMEDDRMTVEGRAARIDEIKRRLGEIDTEYSGAEMPAAASAEWDELLKERVTHVNAIADSNRRAQDLQALAAADPEGATVPGADPGSGYDEAQRAQRSQRAPGAVAPAAPSATQGERGRWRAGAPALTGGRIGNLWDLNEARQQARSTDDLPAIYRERAMRALELAYFPGDRSRSREDIQTGIERLLTSVDSATGTLARLMLLTGSPAYSRAFAKLVAMQGAQGLTTEESRALAMGTPASWSPGSYPVPYQLDPTVTLTSNGAINPLRQIARVEQIVGKEWLGVTSAGVTVTRTSEATESTDASPTLVQPGVAPERVQAFVPFSVEVEQDWNGLMAEISMMLADGKDIEEASSFITGDGTSPAAGGIVGTLSTASIVMSTVTAAITVPDDLDVIESSMAPRFRPQASFIAAKSTFGAVRQAAVTAGDQFDVWARIGSGTPPELIGYPALEASEMSADLTSTTVPYLVMGDFKQFIIVDRIGMSIELVPHLFGSSRMPTGSRGIYAMWRNNCAILAQNAFRGLVSGS